MSNIFWKYKIGDVLYQKTGILLLTDTKVIEKEYYSKSRNLYYTKRIKMYKYTCKKCGYSLGWVRETDLTKGVGCSCCSNMVVVTGINDVSTLRPDLIGYFDNKEDVYKFSIESRKKVNLKCPVCGEKQIKSICDLKNNGFKCIYCNSIGVLRPELKVYFSNQEDSYKYTLGSHSKLNLRCPICRVEKQMIAKDFVTYGFSCPYCTDTISFGEKYFREFLSQLNVKFICQATVKDLSWCGKYRYDFYIPGLNIIIETHGRQHYKKTYGLFGTKTLEEQQKTDLAKERLAVKNGINHYIVIDTSRSIGEVVKKQILNSPLSIYFDLSKIDWGECIIKAQKSLRLEICHFYNENSSFSAAAISRLYGLNEATVRSYLKSGTRDGICNYIGRKE